MRCALHYPDFDHIEKITVGKRHLGDVVKQNSTGLKFYVARKQDLSRVFRKGRKSVSAALRDEVAEWDIEVDTFHKMKRLGVDIVCFHLVKSAELYLVPLSYIREYGAMKDYSSKGGNFKYYINFDYCWHVPIAKESLK